MLIQELMTLKEDQDGPVELTDLIANFPNNYKKAIRKLWGTPRLKLHGRSFFGDGGIYDKLDALAKKAVKADDGVEVEIFTNAEYEGGRIELGYNDKIDIAQSQEVYMGYDPKTDRLFSGWDSSLSEEEFNEQFDDEWKSTFDEEFDYDNTEHRRVYKEAFDRWSEMHPYFVIEIDARTLKVIEVTHTGTEGFYKRGLAMLKRQIPSMIDLRLD